MKKFISIILVLILALSSIQVVFADNNITVKIDGKQIEFDVQPQLINERTMVPMRKIFEELGMIVEWFDETQTVMAAKQGVVVEFPIGSTTVFRNTVEQTIDVPAQLVGGRTLVPVRFVSEFTGAEVVWDGDTNTVFINSKDNIKQLDWNDNYEYWGEVVDGEASGYGALYNKKDASLRQIGKYIDSKIVVGSDLFDSGASFNGNYENGKLAYGTLYFENGDSFVGEFKDGKMNNGTYKYVDGGYFTGTFDTNENFSRGTRYYANGESYIGQFANEKKHGLGTYYFKDGSYHSGNWENGLPNGYGVFYDAVEDVQYEGNYTNDKRDGEFTIKDFYLNKTYYATYIGGVYIENPVVSNPTVSNPVSSNKDGSCAIPGCSRSPQRNSFYCFSHECMDVGCHNQKANDFCNYCVNHKCAVPNCNSSQAYNGIYCFSHECMDVGCHNQKANDFCNYCVNHKCAVPSCNSSQTYNSVYCYIHK